MLEIVSDPWKNTPLVNALQNRGVTIPIIDIRQSAANMSPAMIELEGLIISRKIQHDGDPIMAWMVANVVAHRSGMDQLQPRKESDDKKIDGVMGLLMCIRRGMLRQDGPDFAGRGLWVI